MSIVDGSVVCGCMSEQEGILGSSPDHSQILSCSRGEKLGEGLVPILHYGPEMVDSIFLHCCEIKSGSGLGTRLRVSIVDGSVVCGCVSGQEGVRC